MWAEIIKQIMFSALSIVLIVLAVIIAMHAPTDDSYCKTNACSLSWMVSTGWERVVGAVCFVFIAIVTFVALCHEQIHQRYGNCVAQVAAIIALSAIAAGFVFMAIFPINSEGEFADDMHKAGFLLAIGGLWIYTTANSVHVCRHERCSSCYKTCTVLASLALSAFAVIVIVYFTKDSWKLSAQNDSWKLWTAVLELTLLSASMAYLIFFVFRETNTYSTSLTKFVEYSAITPFRT